MKRRNFVSAAALGAGLFFAGHCVQNGAESTAHQIALVAEYGNREEPAELSSHGNSMRKQALYQGLASVAALGLAGYQREQQYKIDERKKKIETGFQSGIAAYVNDISYFQRINDLTLRQFAQIQEVYPSRPSLPALEALIEEVAIAEVVDIISSNSGADAKVMLHPTHPEYDAGSAA